MPPRLRALELADEPEAWRRAGFAVDDRGACVVGNVLLRLRPQGGPDAIRSWELTDVAPLAALDGIDGLRTVAAGADPPPPNGAPPARHPNGVTGIDHVVVTTPDVDRTTTSLELAGFEVRRVRDAGTGDDARRQAFLWAGEVIVEVVGPADPAGTGPARFWGLALTSQDLDATLALLGDAVGAPRDAVQPGRRIATLRRHVGVRTPVAFLSPHPGGP
jgi:hypothetical protein